MENKSCLEVLGWVLRYDDGRPDATIDVTISKEDEGGFRFAWTGDLAGSFWAEDVEDAKDMGAQYFGIKEDEWVAGQ